MQVAQGPKGIARKFGHVASRHFGEWQRITFHWANNVLKEKVKASDRMVYFLLLRSRSVP